MIRLIQSNQIQGLDLIRHPLRYPTRDVLCYAQPLDYRRKYSTPAGGPARESDGGVTRVTWRGGGRDGRVSAAAPLLTLIRRRLTPIRGRWAARAARDANDATPPLPRATAGCVAEDAGVVDR